MNYLFFLSYELFILILNSVATCVKRYFDHDSHKDISGKGCVPIFHPIVQIVLKKKKKTKKKERKKQKTTFSCVLKAGPLNKGFFFFLSGGACQVSGFDKTILGWGVGCVGDMKRWTEEWQDCDISC